MRRSSMYTMGCTSTKIPTMSEYTPSGIFQLSQILLVSKKIRLRHQIQASFATGVSLISETYEIPSNKKGCLLAAGKRTNQIRASFQSSQRRLQTRSLDFLKQVT